VAPLVGGIAGGIAYRWVTGDRPVLAASREGTVEEPLLGARMPHEAT
jgi:hypothetical protein